jgi:penicillin-binding protein 2
MPPSIEDRRPPITPQLAVRVAVLGGFAFVLFAIVFFRLWFLQVLTGEDYVSQARENRVRKVRIEAPRGNIVDRNGRTLVKTRIAPVVQVVPSQLPPTVLALADEYRKGRARVEAARLRARDQLRGLEREPN